mgnify:CR=1 FL=1
MFLQEFGNDFVLLLELRFQYFDFGDVGVLLPSDIGRVRLPLKGGRSVLEKLFLPVVEVDDTHAMLVTDLRDRHLLKEMLPQNPDFLLRC